MAISGKGGTGKSTIAALIIRWLSENTKQPVLAVDADPNVNLNDLLGVELKETIGSIREEMKKASQNLPGGMTKAQFLEYKIQSTLVETPDFDLIAMGRPEGPGCYCYANNLLRDILFTLSKNYRYVVIDNEAGMEHLSRRTIQDVDFLLIASDPTTRGVRTAARISRLLEELNTRIDKKEMILNRVRGNIPPETEKILSEENLCLGLIIPEDPTLLEADVQGRSVWSFSDSTPSYLAVGDWLQTAIKLEKRNSHDI